MVVVVSVGSVAAIVRCPACGCITAELCYRPEHWEGWARICHLCGNLGLDMTAIPTKRDNWTPDPESFDGPGEG